MTSAKDKIHSYGLRLTRCREVIIKSMEGRCRVTIEDILSHKLVKKSKIDPSTVYRNIIALTKIGLICNYGSGDGKKLYELIEQDKSHHHHHLSCLHCNQYLSVAIPDDNMVTRIFKKNGYEPVSHSIELVGICQNCQLL
jgi:Fur family transcriptional regulator, ferric uptake regulator